MPVGRIRRWSRFRLRTLIALTTVVGVWLGWQVRWIRERQQFLTDAQSQQIALQSIFDDSGEGLFQDPDFGTGFKNSDLSPKRSWTIPNAVLWLFHQEQVSDIRLYYYSKNLAEIAVQGQVDMNRAERLFPESTVWVQFYFSKSTSKAHLR